MSRTRHPFLTVFSVVVAVWLIAPTLIVIPIAFTSTRTFEFPPPGFSTQWFQALIDDPIWIDSLMLSLRVALLAVVLATALGTAAAFAINRGKGKWRVGLNAFVLAPMIVPGVITAIGIYYVFLQWHLTSNYFGFVFAHTVMALPFVVISVGASLQGLDRRLERASASLGAGPIATFFLVTVPLIMPGMLTGALFAFLLSFDEAIISLFLSGPFAKTLPVQLYQSVTISLTPAIAAASTVIIALSTTILMIAAIIASRRRIRNAQ